MLFLLSAVFFQNQLFSKNSLRNTIGVSNGFGSCQDILSILMQEQTVCKVYQQTTSRDSEACFKACLRFKDI